MPLHARGPLIMTQRVATAVQVDINNRKWALGTRTA